jgi:sulfite reductase alpha subunit-like flavoprotein
MLSFLHAAFSRDQRVKIYVQDLIGKTEDSRHLLLDRPDGLLYVCGNRNLPKPLQENLIKTFSRGDEKDPENVAAAVEELYIRGRAQQEVW